MPSQYNTETTESIAERLARALGVAYSVIPIQEIDEHVRAVFEEHAHPIVHALHPREPARANPRAADDGGVERHRCAAHLLRQRDRDRPRLRDALRRHVRRHVAHRRSVQDSTSTASRGTSTHGTDRRKSRRRRSTIKPSAELAADQFDPFDYYVVAPIVGELVERRTSPGRARPAFERARSIRRASSRTPRADGLRQAHDRDVHARSSTTPSSRMRRSVYKRLQGPPIVVVTERAFGFDLRETIINGWEG